MAILQDPLPEVPAPKECLDTCNEVTTIAISNQTKDDGIKCTSELSSAMRRCHDCYMKADIDFAADLLLDFGVGDFFDVCLKENAKDQVVTSVTILTFVTAATTSWTLTATTTNMDGEPTLREEWNVIEANQSGVVSAVRYMPLAASPTGGVGGNNRTVVPSEESSSSSQPEQTRPPLESQQDPQPSNAQPNKALIAGAIVGPIISLALAAGILLYLLRRRKQRHRPLPIPTEDTEALPLEKPMLHSECVPYPRPGSEMEGSYPPSREQSPMSFERTYHSHSNSQPHASHLSNVSFQSLGQGSSQHASYLSLADPATLGAGLGGIQKARSPVEMPAGEDYGDLWRRSNQGNP